MTKQGFVWMLVGVAAGAIAGLLYAPAAGVRVRASAAAKLREGHDFTKRRSERAHGAASQESSSAGRQAGERINRALEANRRTFLG